MGLENFLDNLHDVQGHIEEIVDILEGFDQDLVNEVNIVGDCHSIFISGPDEVIDKLIQAELVYPPEDDDFYEDEDGDEEYDEDDEIGDTPQREYAGPLDDEDPEDDDFEDDTQQQFGTQWWEWGI